MNTKYDEWYEQARKQTQSTIGEFIKDLLSKEHTYDSIIHAAAASAIAGIRAINSDESQGGITGFQIGAIQAEFIAHLGVTEIPARIQEFRRMLYPSGKYRFIGIDQRAWDWVQHEAATMLMSGPTDEKLADHLRNIVSGIPPWGMYVIPKEEP